jgi:hypothetical protein
MRASTSARHLATPHAVQSLSKATPPHVRAELGSSSWKGNEVLLCMVALDHQVS